MTWKRKISDWLRRKWRHRRLRGGFRFGSQIAVYRVAYRHRWWGYHYTASIFCNYPWQHVNPMVISRTPTVDDFLETLAAEADIPRNTVLVYQENELP